MIFTSMPNYPGDPIGLDDNPCWPKTLAPHVEEGWALFKGDPYYIRDRSMYARSEYEFLHPPASFTAGKFPPLKRKRDISFDHDAQVFVENTGNHTVVLTPEEVEADAELRYEVNQQLEELYGELSPPGAETATTTADDAASTAPVGTPAAPGSPSRQTDPIATVTEEASSSGPVETSHPKPTSIARGSRGRGKVRASQD
jgi:hypothetical protein